MDDNQKQLDKEFEKVEAMGSDDQRLGVKATKQIIAEDQEREVKKRLMEEEYLKGLLVKKQVYIRNLAKLLLVRLYEDEFPIHVIYEVIPTEEGIVMELSIGGRLFRQAFKASGDPKYDVNAVEMFVMRAENTIIGINRVVKKHEPRFS